MVPKLGRQSHVWQCQIFSLMIYHFGGISVSTILSKLSASSLTIWMSEIKLGMTMGNGKGREAFLYLTLFYYLLISYYHIIILSTYDNILKVWHWELHRICFFTLKIILFNRFLFNTNTIYKGSINNSIILCIFLHYLEVIGFRYIQKLKINMTI